MAEVQKYIVTGNNYPEWLNNGARLGLVKTIMNEDGKFSYIIIETPTGRKIANVNDVIVKTRSGYSVLSGEQANKYRVTFVPKKKVKVEEREENDENEVKE